MALAWVLAKPAVSSLLIGASRPEQMLANIGALQLALPAEHLARLDDAGTLPQLNPCFIFQLPRPMIFGGQSVTPWRGV